MRIKFLLLIFFIGICICLDNDICFNVIKELAKQDICLASRLDTKRHIASESSNSKEFVRKIALQTKCSGKEFACGHTSSWITEVFQGLKKEYEMYKDWNDGSKVGFKQHDAKSFYKLFLKNKGLSNRVIYFIRHLNTHDHVFVIEQLEGKVGYRIYQSYHDAYSVNAWLSKSLDGLFEEGDIMRPETLKNMVDNLLSSQTGGKVTLANLDDIPEEFISLKPYMTWIRDNEKEIVEQNFYKGWKKFGQGKVLSWEVIKEFIEITGEIITYFNNNDGTSNPYSKDIWTKWMNIYGAWDPTYFPNLPYNAITSMIWKDERKYSFEVKDIVLNNSNCLLNKKVMIGFSGEKA